MVISLLHFICVSSIIFLIGIMGLLINRKSIISIIMSIEIILLSVSINFVAFAAYWNDFTGQIFSLFILAISASEVAIMLAALVIYYNKTSGVWLDSLNNENGKEK